jgi:hypothetical protein
MPRKLLLNVTPIRYKRESIEIELLPYDSHEQLKELREELFSYDIDETARSLANMMDGKLLLVPNTKDLAAPDVVTRYKSLADIERGFKVPRISTSHLEAME